MKTFLLLAFSLTTALAQVANAEDQDQVKHPNKQPNKHQQAPANRRTAITQTPRIQRSATVRQQTAINRAPHFNPVNTKQTPKVRSFVDRDAVRANRLNSNVNTNVNARNRFDRNRTNINSQNRTNTNWQNSTSANLSWADARRRHHRDRHDRSWWSSRYNRFVLFGGGYYFWDNNYWYPAYGYDPYYNSYSYDEPIYGYNDLDPGQVIANVQTELQRLGYYRYAVDGQMGPMTRAAIANYQRDNGLAITSAIDGPTLGSLGLG
jgi:hypothetical protein